METEASLFFVCLVRLEAFLSHWISEFVRKESQYAYADTLGASFMDDLWWGRVNLYHIS